MVQKAVLAAIAMSFACTVVSAQIVTFSDPSEWMTVRSSSVVAKVQLDTAQIPGKKIRMGMYAVSGGKKKAVGVAQNFAIDDFSEEFALGKVDRTVVGGFDYLGIEWSIPGRTDKGICEPFGLVEVAKWPAGEMISVRKCGAGTDVKSVVGGIKESDVRTVGGLSYALAWNEQAFWVACKKGAAGTLEVAMDGKNGKNAFLSYPDRLVQVLPQNDSVYVYHCRRALKDNSIAYTPEVWHTETIKGVSGEWVVAGVRWHDTGIVGAKERAFGFAAFTVDSARTVLASMPVSSIRENPGTWGDVQLVE